MAHLSGLDVARLLNRAKKSQSCPKAKFLCELVASDKSYNLTCVSSEIQTNNREFYWTSLNCVKFLGQIHREYVKETKILESDIELKFLLAEEIIFDGKCVDHFLDSCAVENFLKSL